MVIHPHDLWDVGHIVSIEDGGPVWDLSNLAPEHRGPCNRAAGAHSTNARRRARTDRTRPWV